LGGNALLLVAIVFSPPKIITLIFFALLSVIMVVVDRYPRIDCGPFMASKDLILPSRRKEPKPFSKILIKRNHSIDILDITGILF
jgi:hypothetical protein